MDKITVVNNMTQETAKILKTVAVVPAVNYFLKKRSLQ
jgi:hypothetical protein